MAIIQSGILGGFTGRIGNVVGYTRFGTNVIQKRPAKTSSGNKFPIWWYNVNKSYLSNVWSMMTNADKTSFDKYRISGETLFDCFVRYNRMLNGINGGSSSLLFFSKLESGSNFITLDITVNSSLNQLKFVYSSGKFSPDYDGRCLMFVYSSTGLYSLGSQLLFSVLYPSSTSYLLSDPAIGTYNNYLFIQCYFYNLNKWTHFHYPTFL